MKQYKSRYITLAVTALLLAGIFSACKKDFFEIKDPNGLEVEGSFNDEGAIQLLLNRTYSLIIPGWPPLGNSSTVGNIHNTSDEMNNANTAFLYGQLTENSVTDIGTATSLTANRYADIRRCNQAIDGINTSTGLTTDVKTLLKGQFFFLRAYAYFRLVRLYGGVPLVIHAQGIDDENLQVPRAKTSECVAQIASDLDSAAAYLPRIWPLASTSDAGKVTKEAALAVKGKVLLYWASPQFNPTNISSRWTAAYTACKAAYDTGVGTGYGLYATYANIFLAEDNTNKELVLVRKYNTSKDLGNSVEQLARPSSEVAGGGGGSYQPTWNLVQAYLKSNGMPVTSSDNSVVYDPTLFWLNRDPRFNATIAYNGSYWPLSGNTTRRQWSYTGILDEPNNNTGFYCKKLTNPTLSSAQAVYNSNSGGGNGMDWIEMRFAEVILNLAECANETGGLTEAKNMVRLIRQRAGITTSGTLDYGLSIATDVVSMRSLILNERQIEFAMENMRNYDLRRTRNLGLITTRYGYKPVAKAPYYAGAKPTSPVPPATNIYLDIPDALGVKPRDTVNVNNIAVYTKVFVTPVVLTNLEGTNIISLPDKYYVYPLPTLFTQTPIIQQTIGWAGGTFNPYE